ncbi:hypothetical protein GUITHDRAFT_90093 [Guillardia theta CCMP2712]|uniref:Uncharacterized protein n=1 Tax=Guillardia theta (strain CCMP2712) TaxID=905079 RepID=L1IIF6_GUITC|nr:hypothetical protein GUITHDRAFT_90093 [Guillardia theta CCMP2712]EKX36038.1 hypothetical protein GUITHDRAFT_90093 [Guillardia theta CCMP2712]|eukprot:XP_005823018.1 hypothetical protein GUITHDRAFT_90093 [Guillardia theta CCMP2712]
MVKELGGESEFFGVDKEGNPVKLTLAAKEKLYLDATSAFHNDGKSILSDAEYDKLKSDLAFEGSYVGLMSREEVKFMVAANRYQEGKPIMSDEEFDSLRRKLKQQNSRAVIHEVPTCKVDGQTCKSDLIPDTTKNAVLYFPALIVVTIVWSELAYWFTTLQGGSPNPLTSLVINSPFIAGFTWAITNFLLFQKPFVTSVQCPRCQTYQNIYFGDILFVSGKTEDVVETQCVNKACACNLVANKQKMVCESSLQ